MPITIAALLRRVGREPLICRVEYRFKHESTCLCCCVVLCGSVVDVLRLVDVLLNTSWCIGSELFLNRQRYHTVWSVQGKGELLCVIFSSFITSLVYCLKIYFLIKTTLASCANTCSACTGHNTRIFHCLFFLTANAFCFPPRNIPLSTLQGDSKSGYIATVRAVHSFSKIW
jgi:hypothetical protein